MVEFENIHGKFGFTIGEMYDLDVLDVESAMPYPVDAVKVLGLDESGLKVRFDDRETDYISTDIIVHVEFHKDTD